MGVMTVWNREDAINNAINQYDNGEINRDVFRDEVMYLASNNLEFIDICDFAGAL